MICFTSTDFLLASFFLCFRCFRCFAECWDHPHLNLILSVELFIKPENPCSLPFGRWAVCWAGAAVDTQCFWQHIDTAQDSSRVTCRYISRKSSRGSPPFISLSFSPVLWLVGELSIVFLFYTVAQLSLYLLVGVGLSSLFWPWRPRCLTCFHFCDFIMAFPILSSFFICRRVWLNLCYSLCSPRH